MKQKITFLSLLIISIMWISCSSDDNSIPQPTEISFTNSAETLTVKDSLTLNIKHTPKDLPVPSYKYKSSNPDVAVVKNGKIIALSPGTTTIMATISGTDLSTSTKVTVESEPELTIKYGSKKSLKVGDTLELEAEITPYPSKYSKDDIIWSVSDSKVGDVTEGNIFKAVDEGEVVIKAKTKDGLLEDEIQMSVEHVYIESFYYKGEIANHEFVKTMRVGEKWKFNPEEVLDHISPKNFTSYKVNVQIDYDKWAESNGNGGAVPATVDDNIVFALKTGEPVTFISLKISTVDGGYSNTIGIRVLDKEESMEIGKEYLIRDGRMGIIVNSISHSERKGPNSPGPTNYYLATYTLINHSDDYLQEAGARFLFKNNTFMRADLNAGGYYLDPGEEFSRSLGRFTDSLEQTGDYFYLGGLYWVL